MPIDTSATFTVEELDSQHAVKLPARDLLAALTLFGIPLVGVSDVAVNIDTSGPGWLVGSVG